MVDDEVDDRCGVAQHPVADVDDEHGGGSGDDEAAGVVQLTEDYGLGWIHEMAVAHDHLFYSYMVSLSRGFFIRGFIVFFVFFSRNLLVPGSSSRRWSPPWTGRA